MNVPILMPMIIGNAALIAGVGLWLILRAFRTPARAVVKQYELGAVLEYRNTGGRIPRFVPQIVIHGAREGEYLARIHTRDRKGRSKLYRVSANDLAYYFKNVG